MLSYKQPASNSELKNDTIQVDKCDNINNSLADIQKKAPKKGKKQMAEIVVEPQMEEKKAVQPTQKSQKNEKNNKKKNSTKPNEVVDAGAGSAAVAVVAADTQDTATTGTSKTKKQKSKKEKKAAAAKQQLQQQQLQTENDKNTLNTDHQLTPSLQTSAVKTDKVANEKIVAEFSKKLSAKQEALVISADSNKVVSINQRLLEIMHFFFTY